MPKVYSHRREGADATDPLSLLFSKNMRERRLSAGLSVLQLCSRTGLGEAPLHHIENGPAYWQATIPELRKIAVALGCHPVELLLDGTDLPPSLNPHLPTNFNGSPIGGGNGGNGASPQNGHASVQAPRPSPLLDPWLVMDVAERKLLTAFRNLKRKEKKVILLLAFEMPKCRDLRYEPRARRRKGTARAAALSAVTGFDEHGAPILGFEQPELLPQRKPHHHRILLNEQVALRAEHGVFPAESHRPVRLRQNVKLDELLSIDDDWVRPSHVLAEKVRWAAKLEVDRPRRPKPKKFLPKPRL